jgi:hypothetical protein
MLLNASVLQSAGPQEEMRAGADICIRPALSGVRLLNWRKLDRIVRSGYESVRERLGTVDAAILSRLR